MGREVKLSDLWFILPVTPTSRVVHLVRANYRDGTVVTMSVHGFLDSKSKRYVVQSPAHTLYAVPSDHLIVKSIGEPSFRSLGPVSIQSTFVKRYISITSAVMHTASRLYNHLSRTFARGLRAGILGMLALLKGRVTAPAVKYIHTKLRRTGNTLYVITPDQVIRCGTVRDLAESRVEFSYVYISKGCTIALARV